MNKQFRRTLALIDKSAWLLIAPAVIALFFIDLTMLRTLAQWLAFAPVLVGVAVIVSRIVFPQIHLTELVDEVKKGNAAAGILSGCLVLFVAVLVIGMVMWAKA